jgi:hypothetical protein
MVETNTLAGITLADLAAYVHGGSLPPGQSDHLLMLVGLDDVHGALKFVLSGVQHELHLNMFGYDDDELNDLIWSKVEDPNILVRITLDKSQAGGVHEKKLLDADRTKGLANFNTHFAIGQSAQHQISHTKGAVLDGVIAFHGSTNWSSSGEGTFTLATGPGGRGFKAQNNTQSFFTDAWSINRFRQRLMAEHDIAVAQSAKTTAAKATA